MAESTNTFNEAEKLIILSAKSIIRSKVHYLQGLIHPMYYNNMFLSGGAIASLIQDTQPKDWDVYFMDEQTQKAVIDTFIADHTDEIAVLDEKYRDVVGLKNEMLITENAVTLINGIQFITKHNGTPENVRSTFDFVHCKPYYDFGKDELYISKEQFDLCYNKKLKINNDYSLTIWRGSKFEQRGYTWQL